MFLVHHGIKGMHWGIRRFQNKDGSLTPLGEKRYNVDIERAKNNLQKSEQALYDAKATYYNKTAGGIIYNQKAERVLNKARENTKWAKDDYTAEKIKQKLNSETKISKHRLELEKQYHEKGMTDEEAAVAAYKRDRTEKILKTAAIVGIVAAASYVAYKHYDDSVDKFIKSDTILKRVASNDDKSVHDAFYAVLGNAKMDEKKYVGIYGGQLKDRGKEIYQKSIKVNDAIKVASEKSGRRELAEMIQNNSQFKSQVEQTLRDQSRIKFIYGPKQAQAIEKALASLSKGKVDKNVYRAFNLGLANNTAQTTKDFYQHLASKGYGAVMDMNDKKLSGFMTRTPMIVFDSSKTAVESVRRIGEDEVQKARLAGMMDITIKSLAPTIAGTTAIGAGAAGYNRHNQTVQNDAIVARYRKKHPDTKMSYNEILRSQKR